MALRLLTGRCSCELVLTFMDPFPVPSLLLRVMHVQVKGPGSRAYKRFVAARIIQRWIKKYVSMSAAAASFVPTLPDSCTCVGIAPYIANTGP